MGTRRLTSLVGQTTLGDPPIPESPAPVDADPAPVDADPAPVPPPPLAPQLYGPIVSSSEGLRERQLAWFKERDRRGPISRPVPTDPPG
jgi:hypothetical protein